MHANSKKVDHFIESNIHGNDKCRKCWKTIMFVFVLSLGQSVVERGFSVNKEVELES